MSASAWCRTHCIGTRSTRTATCGSIPTRRTDHVIFGGADHKTGQNDDPEACFAELETALQAIAPHAHVDHRWSGQVLESSDGLPFIGESAEQQFSATGYGGNGLTFGTLAAVMASDWVGGTVNPWSELFAWDRSGLRAGGVRNYLKENRDYPYYRIRDLFVGAEQRPLRVDPARGRPGGPD